MEVSSEHNQLLNNVINLRKRYALVDKLSAKPFNIFKVLRTERNERFTHSAFIAELLSPIGSHCQGDIFLNLFLSQIQWPDIANTEISKAKVKVEQHTGDGFIDIWINLGNACICIENKIDAGEQKDQLLRYNKYCLSQKKPYKVIFLTLDGRESQDKKIAPNFEYEKFSYKEHIISWLDLCIKETARIPTLRETIYQYQQLLKKLCCMLQNENEAMELNELLKRDFGHFEAANNIHEQFKTTKYEVKYDLWNDVKTYFSEKYHENFEVLFRFSENEPNPNISIGDKQADDWYVCFAIEWLHRNPYYGIYSYGFGDRKDSEKKIIDEYQELCFPGYRSSEWWFSYKHYDNVDFSSIETLSQTFSSNEKQNLILEIVEPVDRLIEQYGNRVLEINKEIKLKIG